MNQDIIEMARQAGFEDFDRWAEHYPQETKRWCERMEAFAKLVRNHYSYTHAHLWLTRIEGAVKAEREACAKVCDAGLPIATSLSALDDMEMWGEKFAAAIRARGEQQSCDKHD